jgi:cystathionine beta-synthase
MTAPADPILSARNRAPYDSVLDTIGWTPLIRLHRLGRGVRTPVFGKAEFFNPGGASRTASGCRSSRPPSGAGALKPAARSSRGRAGNTGVGSRSPRR